MALEVVQLLRLPGDRRALVDAETAELGERMGELLRLDAKPDPGRPVMRYARATRDLQQAGLGWNARKRAATGRPTAGASVMVTTSGG